MKYQKVAMESGNASAQTAVPGASHQTGAQSLDPKMLNHQPLDLKVQRVNVASTLCTCCEHVAWNIQHQESFSLLP
jgi:hypothetical protein